MEPEHTPSVDKEVASTENLDKKINFVKIRKSESRYDLIVCRYIEVDLAGPKVPPYILHEPLDGDDYKERDQVVRFPDHIALVSEYTYYFLQTMRHQEDVGLHLIASVRLCANREEMLNYRKVLPTIELRAIRKESVAPPHRYKPLPGPTWTRFLETIPTSLGQKRVNIRFREVELSQLVSNLKYVYLDFPRAWTNISWPDKTQIYCENRSINVPTPLFNLLRIAATSAPCPIWVEALSVDPDSSAEKWLCGHDMTARIQRMAKCAFKPKGPRARYRPLLDSQTEIRLLKIHPASRFEDGVVVDVEHHSLASAPAFVVLSYARGSLPPGELVYNRKCAHMPCTASLQLGLRLLRQRGELVVWTDELCINQEDNVEKSKQAMLMGDIYKRASYVVVDLGFNDGIVTDHPYRLVLPPMIKALASTARALQADCSESPTPHPKEYTQFGIPEYSHCS